jgi:hypothetical protein
MVREAGAQVQPLQRWDGGLPAQPTASCTPSAVMNAIVKALA